MNTKRSNNSNRIKSFGLAACALLTFGILTTDEAAAQCRIGGSPGFGYSNSYRGLDYGDGFGSRFNNRLHSGYGYNAPLGFESNPRGRSSLSFGRSYGNRDFNSIRNYNGLRERGTAGYGNRSNFGNGFYNNREPVAYRHGNHIDVEDGNRRIHLPRRGY